MRIVRPGFGLAPKFYDIVLGKRVNRDLPAGTPVQWDLIA
jgi:N-acetylneuraminate synthase